MPHGRAGHAEVVGHLVLGLAHDDRLTDEVEDAETGRLIPIEKAINDPRGTTIEMMPKAGHGGTPPKKK